MICEIICVAGFLCMSHLDIVHILSAYVHVIQTLSGHMHIMCTLFAVVLDIFLPNRQCQCHPYVISSTLYISYHVGNIPTGLTKDISKCKVDLCTATGTMAASTQDHSSLGFKVKHKHMCIISISNPTLRYSDLWGAQDSAVINAIKHPSVMAVSDAGLIWTLDSQSSPKLGNRFNPCNVSTSAKGDIFIADNGTDRVSETTHMSPLLKM